VVLAEYQHKGKGEGAIENWSGAVLLPYLYFAMQARPRENTWVFVESGGKSGVADYVHSLSAEQKKQIRSMVVLTSLGVSPVILFYSPVEDVYLPPPSLTSKCRWRLPRFPMLACPGPRLSIRCTG
jgi:hypothetical protein